MRRTRTPASLSPLLAAFFVVSLLLFPTLALAQAAPPVADAGPDQNVAWGTTVHFDGSGSTSEVPIKNYTWTFIYGDWPRRLYGVNVNFTFALAGSHNITLNVTDEEGNWDTDVIVVTVGKEPVDYVALYLIPALILAGVVTVILVLWLVVSGRLKFVSESTREKTRLLLKRNRDVSKQVVLKSKMGMVGTFILVFFVLMGIFGPMVAPYGVAFAEENYAEDKFLPPSEDHWMGTDGFKLDIFSELLYGARTSIIVGIFSAFIASVLGALVGLYSGYAGGWKDEVIMRANDVVLSIPWLVLMIIVAAFIGKIDLTGIILIIGLTGWSFTARMVRAQVLSIKERQYIERARCIGASDMAIIRRHVFPNTFPLVFANTILTVAVSILSEATLSFLGLRPQGSVTWGTMLSYAQGNNAFLIGLHWWILAPGLCIVFIVLGFTLLGYALDDALNPKLRKR